MELKMKRIYDAPAPEDGKRIYVDRLWARGLKKTDAALDDWKKEIAPTSELRKWYGHDPEKFEEFREKYREELDRSPAAAAFADELSKEEGTVTLLCSAKDSAHSNAAVLMEWLDEKLQ